MINRTCKNCGSRFTYAVPSRDIPKIIDEKVVRDNEGNIMKLSCRRCRNCGRDYFIDIVGGIDTLPVEAKKLIADVMELRRKKKVN